MDSRNIFTLARSAPGVSQIASGQNNFSAGGFEANYSSNGARLRSNNIMIDGQDVNDPSVTGRQQPMNNTDIVQEIRLITNQFAAEFGRAAGSVMNVVTKSGTNSFDGNRLLVSQRQQPEHAEQSRQGGRPHRCALPGRESGRRRPRRSGRPRADVLLRLFPAVDRRRLGVGFTLTGAPSEAGRQVLQSAAGNRPQVEALLKHLPAGASNGRTSTFTLGGQTYHGAARLAYGFRDADSQRQPGHCAHRSPARSESHLDRPVSVGRQADRQHRRHDTGDAAGTDPEQSVEQPCGERVDEQRVWRDHVERVALRPVALRLRSPRPTIRLDGNPVDRDYRARDDRLQRQHRTARPSASRSTCRSSDTSTHTRCRTTSRSCAVITC